MAVQHGNLKDPLIHEPKGVGVLNSGPSDAGKVYVSDGAGSGIWQGEAGTGLITVPHLETNIILADAVTVPLLGAGDGDLRDDADYTSFIDKFTVDTVLTNDLTIDVAGGGEIVIATSGIYYANFWFSFSEDFGNQLMGISAYKLNTSGIPVYNAATKPLFLDKTRDNGNVSNIGGGSLVSLTAGDKIGIGVAAATAGTLTITDASISMFLIREL